MNIRYNRQKGKTGEREVAEIFSELSGVKYRRVPLSGGLHDFNPSDLMKVEQKESVFDGVHIEVKNTKQVAVPEWVAQVKTGIEDSGGANRFIIAFKHKGEWLFILNRRLFEEKFRPVDN